MSGRRLTALAVAAAAVAAATPHVAAAQTAGLEPSRPLGSADVHASGQVVVDFRSDPATCAAVGRCGIEGTSRWSPPGAARLSLSRRAGRMSASLEPAGGDFRDDAATVVRRRTAGGVRTCTDAIVPNAQMSGAQVGGTVTLPLFEPVAPRLGFACPGPLDADLQKAAPTATVDAAALRRGGLRLDFRGERPFTAAGLTGTVRSTYVADVGRIRPPRESSPPAGVREARERTIASRYVIERVDGAVRLEATAPASPVECLALDACGLTATTVVAPQALRGTFELAASARASIGRGPLLTALGLRPGRPRANVQAGGVAVLTGVGAATTSLTRAGDPQPCRDERPLGGVFVFAIAGRDEVQFALTPWGEPLSRCGGASQPLAATDGLVGARVPLRAFRAQRVVLRFDGPGRLTFGGFPTQVRSDLRIVLRRTGRREEITRTAGWTEYPSG